jgi:hypothetical protein
LTGYGPGGYAEAEVVTDLLGGVHAQGVHDVAEEEHVEFTLAIPIVDVADLLDSCTKKKLNGCTFFSHCPKNL